MKDRYKTTPEHRERARRYYEGNRGHVLKLARIRNGPKRVSRSAGLTLSPVPAPEKETK